MIQGRFATVLNCMDGRMQLPVIYWVKRNLGVEYVDMITEAGMDGKLSDDSYDITNILEKMHISIAHHKSDTIVIVGHHDCVGNPGDYAAHKEDIMSGVDRMKRLLVDCSVIGVWVNRNLQVEEVARR